jgi:uncharacterized membrane protein YccC
VRGWLSRLPVHDPSLAALRVAARAAIVMPSVFAIADKVINDPQVATFAAFGSFSMLVLVEFGGPMRSRFLAYLALAGVGAANIVVGTLCSRNDWLAAGAMAVVGFAILFSGVINGYFAAAGTAALLSFILAATIPASFAVVDERLEGWALAAGAAILAQLFLWPLRPRSPLRADAARSVRALADLAEAELERDREVVADRTRAAGEAARDLRRRFLATPHKPSGPTGPDAALSSIVDELDWLMSLLAPPAQEPGLRVCAEENAEALAAVIAVLRAAAARLEGGDERPDLERLDRARDSLARAVARQIPELPPLPDERALGDAVESAFRIRGLCYASHQIAADALEATGDTVPEAEAEQPSVRVTLQATQQLTVEHASARDVWFRNSIRGAAGLAIAVFIAQRSGLQHGFWVVLGTLSVLRSNALGTGWSIVSALFGTAVGILVGAGLVIAIGTHEAVLWAVLPVAILLASYAPRAISFAAGQAGFTVVLFVLFNLIAPVGWSVGLVRIEDVAIGFAVSLGVGVLFWPRGAGALLRENLAFSFSRNADFVVAAGRQLVTGSASSEPEEEAAAAAAHRLDDAYRQYLVERSAGPVDGESLATLVAGAARVRRTGQSLSSLARMADGGPRLERCGDNLDGEVNALRSWYVTLGDALLRSTAVPPPHTRDTEGRRRLLECVREAVATGDKAKVRPALDLLWASQHLDALWRMEEHLGRHAEHADLSAV